MMSQIEPKKKSLSCYYIAIIVAIVTIAIAQKQFNNPVNGVAIGGGIDLVDHKGERFDLLKNPKGVSLVFFGFTHCPSFCPIAITQLSGALNRLSEDNISDINVLFVTVDPERDTPKKMADFLTHFHSSIRGLTGDRADISKIVSSYKVYSSKVEVDEEGNPTEEEGMHNYIMDHSTYIYVVDKNGDYLEHVGYDEDEDEIVKIIKKYL